MLHIKYIASIFIFHISLIVREFKIIGVAYHLLSCYLHHN
ncbi:hypothetical protein H1P_1390003 [Hyella patelloides LEGE 07179]|uniref:Uncharacterized protein n=1 Tax=Hyella patelloides LEGE 07179 TaxID=945734 RepID=A0A563VLI2_9CYAN|nr:hypothetical protein H1P_1390003 [Hyella patelloides LEGE 07179]